MPPSSCDEVRLREFLQPAAILLSHRSSPTRLAAPIGMQALYTRLIGEVEQ